MNIASELVKIPYHILFEGMASVEEKGIILDSIQVYSVCKDMICEEIGFQILNAGGILKVCPNAFGEAYLLKAERIVGVRKLTVKSDDYLSKHIGKNGDCTFILTDEVADNV